MFGHDKIENMIKNESKYTKHNLNVLHQKIDVLNIRLNELEFMIRELRK